MEIKFLMKGLKNADKLSPNFRKTFEEFIPLWLESLLPHYEEAKKTGVDYLYLANILPVSAPCTLYEKNGIGYHLSVNHGLKELAFNSKHHYVKCNWNECFEMMYPDVDNVSDFCYYHSYMSRLWNKKPEMNEWAERINQCFQDITGDRDVIFSLGSESAIIFNKSVLGFLDQFRPYR